VSKNGGWAFGGERFEAQISEILKRHVAPPPSDPTAGPKKQVILF